VTFATLCLWATATTAVAAQACLSLPVRANEWWLGVGAEHAEAGARARLTGTLRVEDAVALQFDGRWGGYHSEGHASEVGTRLVKPLRHGMPEVCAYGAFDALDYTFVDRFAVDRGTVAERAYRVGLGFALPVADEPGPQPAVTVAVEYVFVDWEMRGSRLVVTDDDITTETVRARSPSHHLAARLGGMLRWGRLGLTGGVGSHPRAGADLWLYLGVGVLTGVF
jgi:hypothetical protein